MKRTQSEVKVNGSTVGKMAINYQVVSEILARQGWGNRMGYQYGDKRNLYKALGYPDEGMLTFEYYFNRYERQDIARAIIDRPCDATWKGEIVPIEPGSTANDSVLNKAWRELDHKFGFKKRLCKADKLCELGRFSLILLGLDDVKDDKGFKNPVSGKRKLLYVKQFAESEVQIHEWEKNPKNERYGQPLIYKIQTGGIKSTGVINSSIAEESKEILVHHSRTLHYITGNLTSEVFGTPKLKPIINRLVDLEKILGGDAEMFWRGARPGYTAIAKDDYELGTGEENALMDVLDKYEHDLRRFITAKGIDIKALEQQIESPLEHIDAQLQAISAQTGIPKRVLIGSERGELASTEDAGQWKELIKTRQEEHAETTVLRPFVNRLMEYGILPKFDVYEVMWDDVFAPSMKDLADIGRLRAESLKAYCAVPLASEVLPPALALKHLLGLNDIQVTEALKAVEAQMSDQERLFLKSVETQMKLKEQNKPEEKESDDDSMDKEDEAIKKPTKPSTKPKRR